MAEGLSAFVAGAAGAPGLLATPPLGGRAKRCSTPTAAICGAGGYPKAMKLGYRLGAMGRDKSAGKFVSGGTPTSPFPGPASSHLPLHSPSTSVPLGPTMLGGPWRRGPHEGSGSTSGAERGVTGVSGSWWPGRRALFPSSHPHRRPSPRRPDLPSCSRRQNLKRGRARGGSPPPEPGGASAPASGRGRAGGALQYGRAPPAVARGPAAGVLYHAAGADVAGCGPRNHRGRSSRAGLPRGKLSRRPVGPPTGPAAKGGA